MPSLTRIEERFIKTKKRHWRKGFRHHKWNYYKVTAQTGSATKAHPGMANLMAKKTNLNHLPMVDCQATSGKHGRYHLSPLKTELLAVISCQCCLFKLNHLIYFICGPRRVLFTHYGWVKVSPKVGCPWDRWWNHGMVGMGGSLKIIEP